MRLNKLYLASVLALFVSLSCYADNGKPMVYSHASITVNRKSPPVAPPPLPWQNLPTPKPENPDVVFDVEIRDAAIFYSQRDWFSLDGLKNNQGMMVALAEPGLAPIIHSTQYAPLDILFIDREGKIIQILPNVKFSAIEEDLFPESPILAFLLLNAGTCQYLSINAGDKVDYALFKKSASPMVNQIPKHTGLSMDPVIKHAPSPTVLVPLIKDGDTLKKTAQ